MNILMRCGGDLGSEAQPDASGRLSDARSRNGGMPGAHCVTAPKFRRRLSNELVHRQHIWSKSLPMSVEPLIGVPFIQSVRSILRPIGEQ